MVDKQINGGELIVLDLHTNEILGVRRVFMAKNKRGTCENMVGKFDTQFIFSVLKPKPDNKQ